MTITRQFHFSAAHRLFNPALSEEENRSLFGDCNRTHGHNYRVQITLKGPVHPETGMIINFHEMDRIVRENVISRFDHKNFEFDIPEFKDRVQTVENLVKIIWGRLQGKFPRGIATAGIRVEETEKSWVEYTGEKG